MPTADTGDALASVTIVTLPGAGKGTLALGDAAVTADQAIAAAALGTLTFTPPANANGSGYASFTFRVSDGTSASAASYTMTVDVTAANDPATGAPTISGTARVGQLLTADASAVADVDGLPAETAYAWQWLRVDGGSDTAITGATESIYRLVEADAGKKFKVQVSFTDEDGSDESRTSAAYPTDTQVSSNAVPTGADKPVTVAEDESYTFAASDFGFVDSDTGDGLAGVTIVAPPGAGKGTLELGGTAVSANQAIAAAALGTLVYTPPANANGSGYASFTFTVSDGTSSSPSYTMTVDVTAANDPATGAPTISGTARVGQLLTADASAIADVDGLPAPATFAWQWLRVSNGSDTAITGATESTYRLVEADAGKKFKVQVSFTDEDGSDESRTSAPYPNPGHAGLGEHGADGRGQDGDGGGGRVLHVRGFGLWVCRHGHG